ncbi:ABC transporter substrate-binding protein, partial [Faecalibaculum rodentium]|uniref:ABC transporter substrate-binding protein n=2 Tax=Faecalibaculum rodentium TaxID=1702221 RepID=UPI0025A1CCAD
EAVPLLATDWTISDDGLEYVFHLRQGVKWHDGSDFTAEDVVFTMDRAKEMPTTKSKAAVVKSAEAVDEHTVKITLEYSYPNFILQLASSYNKFQVNKFSISRFRDARDTIAVGQQGQVL